MTQSPHSPSTYEQLLDFVDRTERQQTKVESAMADLAQELFEAFGQTLGSNVENCLNKSELEFLPVESAKERWRLGISVVLKEKIYEFSVSFLLAKNGVHIQLENGNASLEKFPLYFRRIPNTDHFILSLHGFAMMTWKELLETFWEDNRLYYLEVDKKKPFSIQKDSGLKA